MDTLSLNESSVAAGGLPVARLDWEAGLEPANPLWHILSGTTYEAGIVFACLYHSTTPRDVAQSGVNALCQKKGR